MEMKLTSSNTFSNDYFELIGIPNPEPYKVLWETNFFWKSTLYGSGIIRFWNQLFLKKYLIWFRNHSILKPIFFWKSTLYGSGWTLNETKFFEKVPYMVPEWPYFETKFFKSTLYGSGLIDSWNQTSWKSTLYGPGTPQFWNQTFL